MNSNSCDYCRLAAEVVHHAYMRGCYGCRCRAFSRVVFHERLKGCAQVEMYRTMLIVGGVSNEDVLAAYRSDALHASDGGCGLVLGAVGDFSAPSVAKAVPEESERSEVAQ